MPINDGQLIDLVHSYDHLYNNKRSDFKDIVKKENSWREISLLLNYPVAEVQARWRYLREKYTREKRTQHTTQWQCSESHLGVNDQFILVGSLLKKEESDLEDDYSFQTTVQPTESNELPPTSKKKRSGIIDYCEIPTRSGKKHEKCNKCNDSC
ncbi:hypothetical protein ABEB36_013972 [Hypothenemus hampei]|uniref:Transcription factor Adf-1 n=1 Tax=Hypothenemus hampei TaxID=57062 RepID=A0ABD1E2X6_HYPHA